MIKIDIDLLCQHMIICKENKNVRGLRKMADVDLIYNVVVSQLNLSYRTPSRDIVKMYIFFCTHFPSTYH